MLLLLLLLMCVCVFSILHLLVAMTGGGGVGRCDGGEEERVSNNPKNEKVSPFALLL